MKKLVGDLQSFLQIFMVLELEACDFMNTMTFHIYGDAPSAGKMGDERADTVFHPVKCYGRTSVIP